MSAAHTAFENRGTSFEQLPLPLLDLRGLKFKPRRQFRQRLLAFDRFQDHLELECRRMSPATPFAYDVLLPSSQLKRVHYIVNHVSKLSRFSAPLLESPVRRLNEKPSDSSRQRVGICAATHQPLKLAFKQRTYRASDVLNVL